MVAVSFIFQWNLFTLKPSQGWLVCHTKLCWWHLVALDSCATLLVPIQDLVHLREASVSGAPFTAILPNRKRSGELFLNLLDVRGLTVARTHTQNSPSFYFVSSNYISKPDRILLDGIQYVVFNYPLLLVSGDQIKETKRQARSFGIWSVSRLMSRS